MPFKSGNVLIQLIIVNVAVFLALNIIRIGLFFAGYHDFELESNFRSFFSELAMPMKWDAFIYKPWTIFTYMFTQIGIGHIFWNMFSLYFFGNIIQNLIGFSRTLAIYIYGGLMGALLTLLLHSTVPSMIMKASILLGASGSVLAIVTAAATLSPDKRIFLFIFGEVKLVYIALFFVMLDLIGLTYSDGVGHVCHLGGALTGFLFMRGLKNGSDFSKPFNKIFYGIVGIFKSGNRIKNSNSKKKVFATTARTVNKTNSIKKDSVQSNIDKILDKISKGGYESLTKEEKDYLFRHGKEL